MRGSLRLNRFGSFEGLGSPRGALARLGLGGDPFSPSQRGGARSLAVPVLKITFPLTPDLPAFIDEITIAPLDVAVDRPL